MLIAALAVLALPGDPALAHDYALKQLRIVEPYARATPPGARTGGAYFRIENVGNSNDELVRVASPVAESAGLHLMRMEGGIAKMRAINRIGIPAGAVVTLDPGGYHVMLVGLRQPLAAGSKFPLTLTFAKAGTIEIDVDVIGLTASAPGSSSDPHEHRSKQRP